MKFALINGQRQEAQPSLSGLCPACDQATIAKCGEVKIWHWAHKGRRTCDPWWENETEWHRAWKGQFPDSWQEVVHPAENGIKHIADVRTERGWVIEFQHSYIKPEERRSRDTFYPKLIWVVDGTRRKRDGEQFTKALDEGTPVGTKSPVRLVLSDKCGLLREWTGSNAPIFFDFGGQQVLWWLLSKSPDGPTYVVPYSRAKFIESHRGGATEIAREFDELVKDIPKLVADYELNIRAKALKRAPTQPRLGFQQYLARGDRRRRRF
jgi:competence protein CoiA